METTKTSLQDAVLNALRKERMPVSIFLVNGIRLMGVVDAFDAYVILLKEGGITQAIYKHSISTIVPARPITLPFENASAATGTNTTSTAKKRTPFGLRRSSEPVDIS